MFWSGGSSPARDRGADAGDVAKRAALGIAILVLCGLIAIGGAWAAAAGGETVVAIAVIAAGVAILVGAFVRPVRWLVLPAVALALSAGAVSAAGIDLDGGVGERDYRPTSVADLRDTYELGMGELIVDLRQTDLPAGDVPMAIDLGIGDARVIVPDDVCVATDAQVGIGEARTFELPQRRASTWTSRTCPTPHPSTTRLLVKADVGIGSLRIGHVGTDLDLDHGHFDFGHGRSTSSAATWPVPRSPDPTSVVAGIACSALGVLLLLDASGTLELRFEVLGPAALRGAGSDPAGVRA